MDCRHVDSVPAAELASTDHDIIVTADAESPEATDVRIVHYLKQDNPSRVLMKSILY